MSRAIDLAVAHPLKNHLQGPLDRLDTRIGELLLVVPRDRDPGLGKETCRGVRERILIPAAEVWLAALRPTGRADRSVLTGIRLGERDPLNAC